EIPGKIVPSSPSEDHEDRISENERSEGACCSRSSRDQEAFGTGLNQPSAGISPDPLAARSWQRRPKTAPTSDRIPVRHPHLILCMITSGSVARKRVRRL